MTPTEDHSLSVARPDARDAKTQRDAELQALLARVEAATGPDRELDLRALTTRVCGEGAVLVCRHPDIEESQLPPDHPDRECVLTTGRRQDCDVASTSTFRKREKCQFWRVMHVTAPAPLSLEESGLVLAALLKALASQQPRDQQVAGDRSRETPLLNTSEADEKR